MAFFGIYSKDEKLLAYGLALKLIEIEIFDNESRDLFYDEIMRRGNGKLIQIILDYQNTIWDVEEFLKRGIEPANQPVTLQRKMSELMKKLENVVG
jgi:hypothetical protein